LVFLALAEFQKKETIEIHRIDLTETMLYIKAKELGLNISKICENALKEAIKRLKGQESKNDLNFNCVAGPLGFEPRISGSAGQRPNPC
jgi:hypothetical protein